MCFTSPQGMTAGWWATNRTCRSICWARTRTPPRRRDESDSGAGGGADDDFERHVQFLAGPEFFQGSEDFRFGLSHFFGRELFDERAEGRGDFAELFKVFFDGSRPTAGDDAVFLMDVAEAGGFQRAPQPVALAKHEETRAIGIGWRRRHRNVFQNDAGRRCKEGLLFLAPGDEGGAAAGLEHPETFAERFGQIGKKHDAEA